MAAQETRPAPANPHQPANWDQHESEKAARKAARDKKKGTHRRCLDAVTAAQYEARKALYEWKVKAVISRPNKRGRLEHETYTEQIVAQNENDAWALFCDKIGEHPGPNHCDREITRLAKRSIDSDE